MRNRFGLPSFPHLGNRRSAISGSPVTAEWQAVCAPTLHRRRVMKARERIALALSITLCVASGSFAQGGMDRGSGSAWGGRSYDPTTVETVSGEVVRIDEIHGKGWGQGRGGRGRGYGVHLILRSDKEEVPVHLAPSWYLDKHAMKLSPGDHVEVRGSRIPFGGKPAIIAAEVKKGDQSLKLRDDDGLPAWRSRGRSSRGQ